MLDMSTLCLDAFFQSRIWGGELGGCVGGCVCWWTIPILHM